MSITHRYGETWGDPDRPMPTYKEIWLERNGALADELGVEPAGLLLGEAADILSKPLDDPRRIALAKCIKGLREK